MAMPHSYEESSNIDPEQIEGNMIALQSYMVFKTLTPRITGSLMEGHWPREVQVDVWFSALKVHS